MATPPNRPWWIGSSQTELTRRDSPRVPIRAPVTYAQGQQRGDGMATNTGPRGLFVEVDTSPLPSVGEPIVVILRLVPDQPLPFNGVVSWCNERGFGVQYGPIGSMQTRLLMRLLAGHAHFR